MTCPKRVVTAVLVAGLFAMSASDAQSSVILVHGFNSGGYTWRAGDSGSTTNTAAYIAQHLDVAQVLTPSYTWENPVQSSASYLIGSLPLSTNTILFGHSEGGIVSRTISLTAPLQGVVTMGSPNFGANMAENRHWFIDNLARTSGESGAVRGNLWAIQQTSAIDIVEEAYSYIDYGARYLPYLDGWLNEAVPVVPEMGPSSTLLNETLNSDSAMATQIARAPTRVSVFVEAPEFWRAPEWRLVSDDWGTVVGLSMDVLSSIGFAIAGEADVELTELDQCLPEDYPCDGSGGGIGGETDRVLVPRVAYDAEDDYYRRQDALWNLEIDAFNLGADMWSLDPEWCWDVSVAPAVRDSWIWVPAGADASCQPNDAFISTANMIAPSSDTDEGPESLHGGETSQAVYISHLLARKFLIAEH